MWYGRIFNTLLFGKDVEREKLSAYIFNLGTLKIEAVVCFETVVHLYEVTQHCISVHEDL
jgi:hypothetical protein